jgi:hypothetical protein
MEYQRKNIISTYLVVITSSVSNLGLVAYAELYPQVYLSVVYHKVIWLTELGLFPSITSSKSPMGWEQDSESWGSPEYKYLRFLVRNVGMWRRAKKKTLRALNH